MINLIPIEEKKEIKKNFYFRFLTVSFIMLCFCNIILIVAMFPSYIISLEKKNSINKKLENEKNEFVPEIDQKAVISIKELNSKLSLIEKAKENQFVFSEKVIDKIISNKLSGIKIKSFFYQNDIIDGKKINISGVAQDREQLLSFRQSLENSNSFKSVDLPISNFVKGRNIEFNLDLILK